MYIYIYYVYEKYKPRTSSQRWGDERCAQPCSACAVAKFDAAATASEKKKRHKACGLVDHGKVRLCIMRLIPLGLATIDDRLIEMYSIKNLVSIRVTSFSGQWFCYICDGQYKML